MAAADYYSSRPAAAPAQNSFLAPPKPQPQRASSHSGFVYPQAPFVHPQASSAPNSSPHHMPQVPPPPPYQSPLDSGKPAVHFTPSPPPPQQRSSFSHLQRPGPQSWIQPNTQQNLAPPTSYPSTGPYQPQSYAYLQAPPGAPHMQPYMHGNDSEYSVGSGYSSDPERHRRKRKHKDAGRERGHSTGSRSTATDGFIGAAGGGLIGDLILPGLGTVGGALAGWFGGRDYGNHRKWREHKREKEQRDWEKRYGSRDGDHGHGERSKSHDRRRSHE